MSANFITITPSALEFMKASIDREKCKGIRLDVKSGGCSGMSYEMAFVSNPNPSDVVVEEGGVTVYISAKSALFLANMTIDYVTSPMGGNLVFENPNAKHRCACGKSFSMEDGCGSGGTSCTSGCGSR